jgi:hypothetical protein
MVKNSSELLRIVDNGYKLYTNGDMMGIYLDINKNET